MAASLDLQSIALIIVTLALVAWFFWHTATVMIKGFLELNGYFDKRAERQRLELEREEKFGRRPWWHKVAQKLVLALLLACAAVGVWFQVVD